MRKFYVVFPILLMVGVFVIAKTFGLNSLFGHSFPIGVTAKAAPVFAHCFCKVKANGTEVDALSFDGYKQVLDKGKCETKCRGEWDNSGPGNSQIEAWGKKAPGACGNVRVSMDAYVGTANANEVRSTMIDVGIPCGGGSGTGQSSTNSVSAMALGSKSIRVNYSAEKSPSKWRIRWSIIPLPPNCEALLSKNEATQDNTDDITKGSYDITDLSPNTTYYCHVCALYNGPLYRYIGQAKAKTKRRF